MMHKTMTNITVEVIFIKFIEIQFSFIYLSQLGVRLKNYRKKSVGPTLFIRVSNFPIRCKWPYNVICN